MKSEEDIIKELEPVIKKLKELYAEIDALVEMGIITQEDADDMTGASLDKEDTKTKKKEIDNV